LTRSLDELAAHDTRYHLGRSAVSDADYDALKRRNAEIEARFPALIARIRELRVAPRGAQFSPSSTRGPLRLQRQARSRSRDLRPASGERALSEHSMGSPARTGENRAAARRPPQLGEFSRIRAETAPDLGVRRFSASSRRPSGRRSCWL